MRIRPAAFIIENGKVLLMQYNYNGVAVYNLPGGNYEEGETITSTLERELFEELGVKIEVGKLLIAAEVHPENNKVAVLHLIFHCNILANEPTINKNETSATAISWKNLEDLPKLNLYPNVSLELLSLDLSSKENAYIGAINQPWY